MDTTTSLAHPVLAALMAAAVTSAGIAVIRRHEDWGRRNADYFACFAAGVLITVSFLHLIPTAIEMNRDAPVWLLSGYFLLHLFNRFLTAHVCDRPTSVGYAIGVVPVIGIGLHSFIDGVVYSVTFAVSFFTGALAAFGMILHEFPEGIVTYVLLVQGGLPDRKAARWAFLAAAATTPLGALTSQPFINNLQGSPLGALLALSAGALVYVGATHLLPRAETEPRRYSLVALAAGILTALGIVFGGI
jgi:ZIP family zinc transporter